MEKRGGEVQAPLHAAGERLDEVPPAVGELHGLEDPPDTPGEGPAPQAIELAEDPQVALGAQVRVEGDVLGHEAERAPRLRGAGGDPGPVDGERAAVEGPQARDQRHEGRLPGPVGPEEPEEFPRRDVQGHAVQGGERAEALHDASRRYQGGSRDHFCRRIDRRAASGV